MSSSCTQETYNHSLFLALFSYVTMYMLHTMMGKQMEKDSVHPAIDVATQSQIFFSRFCAVLSSVVADPEMRERAANGGNCELVCALELKDNLALPFFAISSSLLYFSVSFSRISWHISVRYTCIKESVDFRYTNTETPHSAWLKKTSWNFAEATLHASQRIAWLFVARFTKKPSSSSFDRASFVQPFFLWEDPNMKIWSRHQRERDESNPSLTTVDSSLSQLLSLALAYCYYLLFEVSRIWTGLTWCHFRIRHFSTGRKL